MRIQRNAPVRAICGQILVGLIIISCTLLPGAGESQIKPQQASPAETKGKSVVDMTAAELRRLYSKDLSNIEFDNTHQQFWLPREVYVSWEFPNYTYCNLHKYSDYHLFAVESDYKVTQPKTLK
jgi:hypothetical protein